VPVKPPQGEPITRGVKRLRDQIGDGETALAPEIDPPLASLEDSVAFLEEAVDTLLRLIWLYRETLFGDVPIRLHERRALMRAAETRAELDYLCDRIPLALMELMRSRYSEAS
jgi:hypothetical protein